MITRKKTRSGGRFWIVVYAGLCVIMAVVGWTSIMMIVPGADASVASAMPQATGTPGRSATSAPTDDGPTLTPAETPAALPTKAAFYIDLYRPGTFVSQMTREYCMAGAVQNMLNIIGPKADLTTDRQRQIGNLLVSLTTRQDSFNGGFGPGGWALAMPKLGAGKYKLVVDSTLDQALRDAAVALADTGRPVGLLTWKGAHSWVMTGFRADADPLLFPDTFKLKGAFIVDPFYPRVSSIWGATLGPDTYRNPADMAKNYVVWKRPEGHYPGRDGKWLLVIPIAG